MNDNLADQLRTLSELSQQGHLSATEFESAKAKLLATGASAVDFEPAPSVVVLQNELANLDRQWTIDREKYKVAGRYSSSIPAPGSGTTTGIVMTVFGVIWTLMAGSIATNATSHGGPGFMMLFPLFGVFFVVGGLAKGREMNQKGDAYKKAEEGYQRRRAAIEAKIKLGNN